MFEDLAVIRKIRLMRKKKSVTCNRKIQMIFLKSRVKITIQEYSQIAQDLKYISDIQVSKKIMISAIWTLRKNLINFYFSYRDPL